VGFARAAVFVEAMDASERLGRVDDSSAITFG
jgi:hypothetical protein